jgi:DNA methylase
MQKSLFNVESSSPSSFSGVPTQGYKGLSAFHKYWGKKPQEQLAHLIESLSAEGDIIVDPFVGSGLVAREALNQRRRFVGCDVNPVAVEMTRLFANLHYSANSVVQDNRNGSLKTDFALIYSKPVAFSDTANLNGITQFPGWSSNFPA